MDQRLETTTFIEELETVCNNYRKDYKLFSNKFDKLAVLIILQVNDFSKNHSHNVQFLQTILSCFMEAVTDFLIQEESNRFLKQLTPLCSRYKTNLERDLYEDEIVLFSAHLKKHSSFFADLTLFNTDIFAEKYRSLHPENTEKSYRIEGLKRGTYYTNNKRLTQEDADFMNTICDM